MLSTMPYKVIKSNHLGNRRRVKTYTRQESCSPYELCNCTHSWRLGPVLLSGLHASFKGDVLFASEFKKSEICLVMIVKPIDCSAVLTGLFIGSSMVTPFPLYRPYSRTCMP